MPKKPVALWTADWHAKRDDCIWGKRKEIAGDVGVGICQVIAIAEKYDVKVVGIAGDVTNERMQYSSSIEMLRHALDTFQQQKREVWHVQGNHDNDDPPVLSAMHGWPSHLHGNARELWDSGIIVYGLDYQYPGYVEAQLAATGDVKADVLFTHQTWKDWMSEDTGHVWFKQVPEHFSMVITGDLHKHAMESATDTVRHCTVPLQMLSPGPLCMHRISECEPKGVFIMYDDMTVESVPLATRGFFSAEIMDEAALVQFLDEWPCCPARTPQVGVSQAIAKNILRVWYNPGIPDAWQQIEQRVGMDVHLFKTSVKPEVEEVKIAKQTRLQTIIDSGIDGCITKFYGDDPKVRDDGLQMWQHGDAKLTAMELYKARLTENLHGQTQSAENQPAGQDPRRKILPGTSPCSINSAIGPTRQVR